MAARKAKKWLKAQKFEHDQDDIFIDVAPEDRGTAASLHHLKWLSRVNDGRFRVMAYGLDQIGRFGRKRVQS